ncbi:MAG: DUF5606 family protein [Chitinophagaceae bacterium]
MDYSKIISVTGLSGLYELVASKADGAVVKSLEDKSTKFVSSRVHNFSHLESIEIYTVKDNTVLAEVFKEIKNSKEPLPDAKADGKELKSYFEKVYPDLDFERVYASDMRKIIKWYSIVTENNIEIKQKSENEEDNTEGGSVIEEIKNETPVPQEESEKNSK